MMLTSTTQLPAPGANNYEMAIRLEQLRVQEALNARDVAVTRLADACASVHEKTKTVDSLREEKERLRRQLDAYKDRGGIDKENRNVSIGNAGEDSHGQTDPMKAVESRFGLLQVADAARLDSVANDPKVPHKSRLHTIWLSGY